MSIRLSDIVRVRVHRNCEGMNDLIVRLNAIGPMFLTSLNPSTEIRFYAISCGLSGILGYYPDLEASLSFRAFTFLNGDAQRARVCSIPETGRASG